MLYQMKNSISLNFVYSFDWFFSLTILRKIKKKKYIHWSSFLPLSFRFIQVKCFELFAEFFDFCHN